MTNKKVVHVQSFVIEVDENTSEQGVHEEANRRLMEEPPKIESIEDLEG